LMKDRRFDSTRESFPMFLTQTFREDRLANGQIERLNRSFFAGQ